jgi:lysozyme family protein
MASPAAIDRYLAHLVDVVETGTYTDDPADGGGPTRWGITQATLATWRDHPVTAEDVRELSRTEALAILRARYVTEPGFDKLVAIDTGVGMEAIDTGVNMSQTTAARWLQRALNVLNRRGKGWPDIRVDGRCGPKTLGTVRAMQLARG